MSNMIVFFIYSIAKGRYFKYQKNLILVIGTFGLKKKQHTRYLKI